MAEISTRPEDQILSFRRRKILDFNAFVTGL